MGEDLETGYESKGQNEKEHVKVTLQQLVLWKMGENRVETGLYSPLNVIQLPSNHKWCFDENPTLLVVPILSLEGVKAWNKDDEYWAVCIVGKSEEIKASTSYSRIFGDANF